MRSKNSTLDDNPLTAMLAHWARAPESGEVAHPNLTRRRFRAGETIAPEFEIPREWMFVLQGAAYVRQTSRSGRELIVERVRPGHGSGFVSLAILMHRELHGECVAATPLEVAVLPSIAFRAAFRPPWESPWLRAGVLSDVSRSLSEVAEDLVEGSSTRVAARLASILLDHAQQASGVTEIPVTHAQLARELGAARETVSRNLRSMARDGLIDTRHGVIIVANRRALEAMAADT